MITISRTLIKDDKSSIIIWDRGYEFWELEGDVLRHFRLLERRLIDQEGKKEQENKKDQGSLKDQSYPQILEVLEVLNESPIPLECYRQELQGWRSLPLKETEEKTVSPSKKEQEPLLQEQKQKKASASQRYPQPRPVKCLILSSDQQMPHESQDISQQQSSYNHSMEAWSTLSPWIPIQALPHHESSLISSR